MSKLDRINDRSRHESTSVNRRRQSRPAFTLLEVLLVLVVIGLLAGLAAPVLFGLKDKAQADTVRAQINLFYESCDLYRFHARDYPLNLEQLTDPGSLGPETSDALMESIPVDPWGQPYVYEYRPGAKPNIYSVGMDGISGTPDDIYREEVTP